MKPLEHFFFNISIKNQDTVSLSLKNMIYCCILRSLRYKFTALFTVATLGFFSLFQKFKIPFKQQRTITSTKLNENLSCTQQIQRKSSFSRSKTMSNLLNQEIIIADEKTPLVSLCYSTGSSTFSETNSSLSEKNTEKKKHSLRICLCKKDQHKWIGLSIDVCDKCFHKLIN